MKKYIVFEKHLHKLIFDIELSNQIKNGVWRNAKPKNHFEVFEDLTTTSTEKEQTKLPGCYNFKLKRTYNFNHRFALDQYQYKLKFYLKLYYYLSNLGDEYIENYFNKQTCNKLLCLTTEDGEVHLDINWKDQIYNYEHIIEALKTLNEIDIFTKNDFEKKILSKVIISADIRYILTQIKKVIKIGKCYSDQGNI